MNLLEEVYFVKNPLWKNCKNIGVYGTGLAGETVFFALQKMNIQVNFFLTGSREKIGLTFCGRNILDISKVSMNAFILIAANPIYGIHERLSKVGISQWEYVDPEYLHLLSEGFGYEKIRAVLKENKDSICKAYDMLEDKKSKEVFWRILQHRLGHNLSLISNIYDENQYFGNDVIGKVGGNFIDCGAYTGDTLRRFMNQVGGAYYYYAFEAEKVNYGELVDYCRKNDIANVDAYNIAVYDQKTKLNFIRDEGEEKVSGKTVETREGAEGFMQADSIDNILHNTEIDVIVMDIEGSEIHGLRGARESINRWHPRLAISAYHVIEHLWEVPLCIKEIDPGYRFFYRHHRWNMHDTVLYAIHKDDN